MDCDIWRLRVAESHYPDSCEVVVASEQLAGQEP